MCQLYMRERATNETTFPQHSITAGVTLPSPSRLLRLSSFWCNSVCVVDRQKQQQGKEIRRKQYMEG